MTKQEILKQKMQHDPVCPLRYSLGIIGGKWKLPILCLLATGKPWRYSAIKRKVPGITNMMLSQSLKELEEYGIISRKQYPEIPPKVEYSLTEEGRGLLPVLDQLATWGLQHMQSHAASCACSICKDEAVVSVEESC